MDYRYIASQIKGSSNKNGSFPIHCLELIHENSVTTFEVGLQDDESEFFVCLIEELGNKCFHIYGVDSGGSIFLLTELSASKTASVVLSFFKDDKEVADTLFSMFVGEESHDVKYLSKFGAWVARNDLKEVVIATRCDSEFSRLINRNEGHFAVVCKDNFDRETKAEYFATGNYVNKGAAEAKAAELNQGVAVGDGDFYAVVALPYELFTPDF